MNIVLHDFNGHTLVLNATGLVFTDETSTGGRGSAVWQGGQQVAQVEESISTIASKLGAT